MGVVLKLRNVERIKFGLDVRLQSKPPHHGALVQELSQISKLVLGQDLWLFRTFEVLPDCKQAARA